MNNRAALDWVNFLLANVKDGLGPFLAVYLLATQHWEAGRIGIVMMIAGVATVLARAPIGAFLDCTYRKRGLIVVASATVAIGAVAMSLFPTFAPVAIAQAAVGVADAAFPPPSLPYHSASWAQTPSPSESVGMKPLLTQVPPRRRSRLGWQAGLSRRGQCCGSSRC